MIPNQSAQSGVGGSLAGADQHAPHTYIGADADGRMLVPDAHDLFSGVFKRSGSDLVIEGPSGARYVAPEYFSGDAPADLISPKGAVLTGDVVAQLAGPRFPEVYAQAGGPAPGAAAIGQVETLAGTATAARGGATVTLQIGSPVFQGDVVSTGGGSSLGITFADRTVLSLGDSARMTLDRFVYAPGGGAQNSMLFNLVQGTFVFVAGQVAPTGDMRLETPVATMGVRGTTGVIRVVAVDGTSLFTLVQDPGGGVGAFDVLNKTTGALIKAFRQLNELLIVQNISGQSQEVSKTPADLAIEQVAIGQAVNAFNAGAARIQRGEQPVNQQGPGTPDPNQPGQPGGPPQPPDGPQPQRGGSLDSPTRLADAGDAASDLTQSLNSIYATGPRVGALDPASSIALLPNERNDSVGLIVPVALTDSGGLSGPTAVVPSVILVRGPAILLPGTPTVAEDGTIGVTGIFVGDPDSSILSVTITSLSTVTLGTTAGLTFSIGDGVDDETMTFTGAAGAVAAALASLTYFPTFNNDGVGGIRIRVTDETGLTDEQNLIVNITPQPDAPVITGGPATVAVTAGSAPVNIDLRTNASDPDRGAVLSIANVVGLVAGLAVAGNTLTIDPANAAFESIAQGQAQVITVTYDVVDETGLATPHATQVTIFGVNDAPRSSGPVTGSGTEDTVFITTFDLLANATDPDNNASLSVGSVSGLTAGMSIVNNELFVNFTSAEFQSIAAGATRDYAISYVVTDEFGASVAQTAVVTVTGVNDAPVVGAPLVVNLTAGSTQPFVVVNQLQGVTDVDTPLALVSATSPIGALPQGALVASNAVSLYLNTYESIRLGAGQTQTFASTFDVVDQFVAASPGQSLTIKVTGVNDAPFDGFTPTAYWVGQGSIFAYNNYGFAELDGSVANPATGDTYVVTASIGGTQLGATPFNGFTFVDGLGNQVAGQQPGTGLLSGNASVATGIYTVTFTATDAAGLSTSSTGQIIVTDQVAPFTGGTIGDAASTTALVLLGLDGSDQLLGGLGDDLLNGGIGPDTINGGAGFDVADYSFYNVGQFPYSGGIDASLIGNSVFGFANDGLDTLVDIEGIRGSNYVDTITGNSSANFIDGQQGDDILIGGGGADTILGGAGSDLLRVADADFGLIDGGSSVGSNANNGNILKLDGGFNLDLTAKANTAIKNIQAIDLTNGQANVLSLDLSDVFDMTAFPLNPLFATTHAPGHTLVIGGESADIVNLSSVGGSGSWQLISSSAVTSPNPGNYNIYDYVSGGQVIASVAIEQVVQQIVT